MYLNNWIYHASFSPIWFDRIKDNRGFVDYKNERVNFVDDDYEEIFTNFGNKINENDKVLLYFTGHGGKMSNQKTQELISNNDQDELNIMKTDNLFNKSLAYGMKAMSSSIIIIRGYFFSLAILTISKIERVIPIYEFVSIALKTS
jgi:hypothetical protein